jgi:hypothetical protein
LPPPVQPPTTRPAIARSIVTRSPAPFVRRRFVAEPHSEVPPPPVPARAPARLVDTDRPPITPPASFATTEGVSTPVDRPEVNASPDAIAAPFGPRHLTRQAAGAPAVARAASQSTPTVRRGLDQPVAVVPRSPADHMLPAPTPTTAGGAVAPLSVQRAAEAPATTATTDAPGSATAVDHNLTAGFETSFEQTYQRFKRRLRRELLDERARRVIGIEV